MNTQISQAAQIKELQRLLDNARDTALRQYDEILELKAELMAPSPEVTATCAEFTPPFPVTTETEEVIGRFIIAESSTTERWLGLTAAGVGIVAVIFWLVASVVIL